MALERLLPHSTGFGPRAGKHGFLAGALRSDLPRLEPTILPRTSHLFEHVLEATAGAPTSSRSAARDAIRWNRHVSHTPACSVGARVTPGNTKNVPGKPPKTQKKRFYQRRLREPFPGRFGLSYEFLPKPGLGSWEPVGEFSRFGAFENRFLTFPLVTVALSVFNPVFCFCFGRSLFPGRCPAHPLSRSNPRVKKVVKGGDLPPPLSALATQWRRVPPFPKVSEKCEKGSICTLSRGIFCCVSVISVPAPCSRCTTAFGGPAKERERERN